MPFSYRNQINSEGRSKSEIGGGGKGLLGLPLPGDFGVFLTKVQSSFNAKSVELLFTLTGKKFGTFVKIFSTSGIAKVLRISGKSE